MYFFSQSIHVCILLVHLNCSLRACVFPQPAYYIVRASSAGTSCDPDLALGNSLGKSMAMESQNRRDGRVRYSCDYIIVRLHAQCVSFLTQSCFSFYYHCTAILSCATLIDRTRKELIQ